MKNEEWEKRIYPYEVKLRALTRRVEVLEKSITDSSAIDHGLVKTVFLLEQENMELQAKNKLLKEEVETMKKFKKEYLDYLRDKG